MKPAKATIHINGAQDTLTVDGRTFDRSKMTNKERHMVRRLVVQQFAQEQHSDD